MSHVAESVGLPQHGPATADAALDLPQQRPAPAEDAPTDGHSWPGRHRRGLDGWYAWFGHVAFTALLAFCALEPIVVQLFWRRVDRGRLVPSGYDHQAVQAAFTSWGTWAAVAVVAVALIRPRQVLRQPRWLLAGAALLWVTASLVNTRTGFRPGPASLELLALAVLAAFVVLPRPPVVVVLAQIRFWLAVYVWGSLIAIVVDSSWALVPVPDGTGAPWGQARLWGLSSHPNHLAPIAALLIVLELARHGLRRRSLVTCAAAGAVVLLTGTLTALVCLVVVGGYVTAQRMRRSDWRPTRVQGALVAVLGAVTGVGLLLTVRPDFLREWHILLSADGRTRIWQAAIRVWLDHPVNGYGPYVFDKTAQLEYLGPNSGNLGSAHSQYLQAFAQGGIILGTILVLYVAALWWTCRRLPAGPAATAATAACLVLLVTMLTEVVLRSGPNSSFYLLHVAVLLVVLTTSVRRTPSRSEPASSNDGSSGHNAADDHTSAATNAVRPA